MEEVKERMIVRSVSMPRSMEERLIQQAKREKRNVSQMARVAIAAYLEAQAAQQEVTYATR